MSERSLSRPEFDATNAADVLDGWFEQEIDNSNQGQNSVLNDWDNFQRGFSLPFGPANPISAKANSHYNRLNVFTEQAMQDSWYMNNDIFVARQIFCAQMSAAGAYRWQSFMQATSIDEYHSRRTHAPIGVDLTKIVSAQFDELAQIKLGEADILQATLQTNEASFKNTKHVVDHGMNDTGKKFSPSVETLQNTQDDWIKLAASYFVYAARERGSLQAVPLWEPKSISEDPQVYYPFNRT